LPSCRPVRAGVGGFHSAGASTEARDEAAYAGRVAAVLLAELCFEQLIFNARLYRCAEHIEGPEQEEENVEGREGAAEPERQITRIGRMAQEAERAFDD
jgi:hypothetical protein